MLESVLEVLTPALDIVEGRVEEPEPPEWCRRRGWTEFLATLGDHELRLCEAEGLAARLPFLEDVPESLGRLGRTVLRVTEVPWLHPSRPVSLDMALREVSARKQRQLWPLLGMLQPMAAASTRIVEFGSGSGHLTRLAARWFGRHALGVERNPERVAFASRRVDPATEVSFLTADACTETPELSQRDLVVGLHACGELGDHLVQAAAHAGSDAVLVSCCPQKIRGRVRSPLSRRAGGLGLSREYLGLANLTSRRQGVEADIGATMTAREARFALRSLLGERGIALSTGAELRGTNRRRAHAGFPQLAENVLGGRGLPVPTAQELERHAIQASQRFALVRRFSLPRNLLSRLIELFLVLDRAEYLQEKGLAACIGQVFDPRVTPRNLALFASRDERRLPPAEA